LEDCTMTTAPQRDSSGRPKEPTQILRKRVNWVLDADIRGFFDAIDHGWLVKFLEHRIADWARPCAGQNVSSIGDSLACIWTRQGWMYPAAIIDLYSRKVVADASSNEWCWYVPRERLRAYTSSHATMAGAQR
jgi:hypothetical protein